jgi:hypothetical protein
MRVAFLACDHDPALEGLGVNRSESRFVDAML